MSVRRPASAAPAPILILGLVLSLAACTTNGPTSVPTAQTAGPTAAAPATTAPSAAASQAVSPTPTPVSGTAACDPKALAAAITDWSGAAGNRIATVTLTNNGKSTCSIHALATPQLVDANDKILLQGQPPSSTSTVTLAYYDVVKTMVSAANYCGAATATGPVSVAFIFPSGEGRIVAAPLAGGDPLFGVPPCNGSPGSAGQIDMQPFAP